MSKIAFVFPGQGAQYIGMGKQISDKYIESKNVFKSASEALSFDIEKMIFEGEQETLTLTENAQPAILTTSVACMMPLIENGIKPDVVAGLSLGEYSAHVAAGTISFKDAVRLVRKRGRFMQEVVPAGIGTMAAILELSKEDVVECCKQASVLGTVEPANFNCPGQIVISGEVKAVEKAMSLAKEKGAKRTILLPVSAPFHCSMLKLAGEALAIELENINFNNMNIPVVTNVTAEYIKEKNLVKDLLIRQVSSTVNWEDSIRNMINQGINVFIEIGPGKVLSGFIKKISKDVKIFNVEDISSLDKVVETFNM